jgi:hypothetical protein
MATVVAPSPRPSSAQASHETLVLPPLPESQVARPPTAPGRRPPEDDAARQVPDDYFTLPRIETATRMAEDPTPYQPPQAAVSTRVPGSKLSKAGEGLDLSQSGAGDIGSSQREVGSLKDRGDAVGPDAGISRSSALDATLDGREAEAEGGSGQRPGAGDTGSAAPDAGGRVESVAQEKKAARRGPLPSQVKKQQEKEGFAAQLAGTTGPLTGERKGEFTTVGKADATVDGDNTGEVMVTEESHAIGVPQVLPIPNIQLCTHAHTLACARAGRDASTHAVCDCVALSEFRPRLPNSVWSASDRATCARTLARARARAPTPTIRWPG